MNHSETVKELFRAVQMNESSTVVRLLEADPILVNTENDEGLTPLGYASHFGQTEVVKLLLEYGANVNAISHSKISNIPSNTALLPQLRVNGIWKSLKLF